MTQLAWIVFLCAAVLEVGGDALIRKGLRGQGNFLIVLGFLVLGCYGLVVNKVPWDFSKLLGVYVAVFACVSMAFGVVFFHESLSRSTWAGLALIVTGGLLIQYGAH